MEAASLSQPEQGRADAAAGSQGATRAAIVVLALAGLAAYAGSFSGVFVFDDIPAILSNERIRHLWPPNWLLGGGVRPALNLSLAISYALGGVAPFWYHAFNLAVHILAAFTLFGIVRRTLRLPAMSARFGAAATPLALAAALIWEVHPLQTESVTYIIQRAESLMGLFYLLVLYAVIRGASSARPMGWHAAALSACALGMGCKEVMATVPVAVLLYDRTFLAGSFGGALRQRRWLYAGLAAMWGLILAFLPALGQRAGTAGFGIAGVSSAAYAATQPGVILHYLRLAFWPAGLSLDIGWPLAQTSGQIAPAAVAVGLLLAVTAWGVARRTAWAFLGAWFFLILSPTSSFVPLTDPAVEHRMYLPLAAVVVAAVMAGYAAIQKLARLTDASEEVRRKRVRGAALAAVSIVALSLMGLTLLRNATYGSAILLWDDAIRQNPGNARAWSNRGVALHEKGKVEEALRNYDEALRLRPAYPEALRNRGLALKQLGRSAEGAQSVSEALAIEADEAVRQTPNNAEAWQRLGVALAGLGRDADALDAYARAIRLQPEEARTYNNRGLLYARRREFQKALNDFDRAIALRGDYAAAYYNRGNLRMDLGDNAKAVGDFSLALQCKPDYAQALNNRAVARHQLRDYDGAWADVKRLRAMDAEPTAEFLRALRAASGREE